MVSATRAANCCLRIASAFSTVCREHGLSMDRIDLSGTVIGCYGESLCGGSSRGAGETKKLFVRVLSHSRPENTSILGLRSMCETTRLLSGAFASEGKLRVCLRDAQTAVADHGSHHLHFKVRSRDVSVLRATLLQF